jgi:tetratricopeptide (TPR) repeat protein
VGHYSKAIELDDSNKVYYSNRSNAYAQIQKFNEALADANRAIELDPNWSRGYGRKGVALFFLGRYKEAAEAYAAGLKVEPGNAGFMQEAARCQAFVFGEPFLRPDWAAALESSQLTAGLMQDPKFVQKIQAVRANPTTLQSLLNSDMEVTQAYIVLSGQEKEIRERQVRDEAKKADEARKRREDMKKREAEEAERKRREEFESLPENKQKAITLKEEGNAAYKAQDFATALSKYRAASEADPEAPVYLTNMASVYMAQKEYALAVSTCDQAIAVGREHFADFEQMGKAHFRKAKALAKLEQWKECVAAYDEGLLSFRDPASVKLRNQAEEKLKETEAKAYLDPVKAEEAKAEGNDFYKAENWGDAVRSYSEAIRRNPDNAVYYGNRAMTYMKLREYQLALADADECIRLDPGFIKGWLRKGMAHHYLKEYYKALEAYDKGMKIDPQYAELTEWAAKTTQAINRMHTAGGKEDAEVARQKAMSDPEIQKILRDSEIQTLMRTLQAGDRAGAEAMLKKSKGLYAKYEQLSRAGLM